MRTKDVKVDGEYLYKGEKVTVLKRIKGEETVKRNMQSGECFTGMHCQQKKFLLSNNEIVYSNNLNLIK